MLLSVVLKERLEEWLKLAERTTEIPAPEADWRRVLLKTAERIAPCKELVGSQSEKDLQDAVAIARTGNLEGFESVRELYHRVLADMRSKGIG